MMTHKSAIDVLGIGTVLVDHQVVLSRPLEVDQKHEIAHDRYQVGGPVPTGLVLLARYGCRCAFIGTWAKDGYGRWIEEDLARERVDIRHSRASSEGRTGYAHVWVDPYNGSRTIAFCRGSNRITESDLPIEEMEPSPRALYLDGWCSEAAAAAAVWVKRGGGIVFLDCGSSKPGLEKLLPLVDVLNCPERIIGELVPNGGHRGDPSNLLDMGPKIVTVTRGQNGASAFTKTKKWHQRAFDVETVDSTGAGDVFCGAFLYCLLNSYEIGEALRFASGAAALKCAELGNREGLPSMAAVLRLIAAKA